MTVIAAVAREGRVTIAADTISTGGGTRFQSPPKIRRFGDDGRVLVACAGSASLGPSLRDLGGWDPLDDLDEWAQRVAEMVTDTLAERKPSLIDEDALRGELVLGYAGRLWYLDANLASPAHNGIAVIGSGSDVAYGALVASLALGRDPYLAACEAVTIACQRNAGCGLLDGVPQVECA